MKRIELFTMEYIRRKKKAFEKYLILFIDAITLKNRE